MKYSQSSGGWTKVGSGPVLGDADTGTIFDLSVLAHDGGYAMYASWRPKKSISRSHSADGISWTGPEVVFGPNASTGWEEDINRPSVLRRDDGYHMWYTGQKDGHSWIGYARSDDGRSWRRMSREPVMSPERSWEKVAVMCPHVLWDGDENVFRMWYSGGEQYEPDAIGYATSSDGMTWTKHAANPIFREEPANPWESRKVTACQVVREGSQYLMFYIGFEDIHTARIGIARSPDGVGGWVRNKSNPVIAPTPGAWDGDACYKPFAVYDGRKWLMWYNGRNGAPEYIGLATHEGRDLGF